MDMEGARVRMNAEMDIQRQQVPFTIICNEVITDKELSPTDKLVYTVLCMFSRGGARNGGCSYPKISTIAESAGVSITTVRCSLKALAARGWLRYEAQRKGVHQGPNMYYLFNARQTEAQAEAQTQDPEACCQTSDFEPSDSERSKSGTHKQDKNIKPNDTVPTVLAERPAVESKHGSSAGLETHERVAANRSIPDALKPTVEYMLLRTGREVIDASEEEPIALLAERHTPLRIQKEISAAIERFIRKGRSVRTLTFGYIWQSLRKQPPTLKPRDVPARQKPSGLSPEEQRRFEEQLAMYGGGSGGTDS